MAHNARIAAELAARPSAVVDTRTAAAGQGLVVGAGSPPQPMVPDSTP